MMTSCPALSDTKLVSEILTFSPYFMRTMLTDNHLVHCSMLAEDAIKSAISNYYTKNPNAKTTNLGGTGAAMPKIEVETVVESATA